MDVIATVNIKTPIWFLHPFIWNNVFCSILAAKSNNIIILHTIDANIPSFDNLSNTCRQHSNKINPQYSSWEMVKMLRREVPHLHIHYNIIEISFSIIYTGKKSCLWCPWWMEEQVHISIRNRECNSRTVFQCYSTSEHIKWACLIIKEKKTLFMFLSL